MILTDLMEYVGKRVLVVLETGETYEGVLEYIPSWSEQYGWRRAHYFYIGENYFRCHFVSLCCIKPL